MVANHDDAELRELMRVNLGDKLLTQVEAALALDGWTHHACDLLRRAKAGSYQMFQSANAVVWTEVVQFPRIKTLFVILAAGDLRELFEIIHPQVEAFADREGCQRMDCGGREGWGRACRALGYETHQRTNTWAMRPKNKKEAAA